MILEEEQRIWDFCSYGDRIFYSLRVDSEGEAGQEIWEYNWISGEKSLLLEGAECTYVTAYNGYLVGRRYDSGLGAYDVTCVKGETGEDILGDYNDSRGLPEDSSYGKRILDNAEALEEAMKCENKKNN